MKKIMGILLVFLLGLYVVSNYTPQMIEGFSERRGYECPDILLKKGSKIFLKKSGKAIIPGVNPIVFDNLEQYSEFLQWQRSQNINCPILNLEESYNTQGEKVYKIRPDIFNTHGGLNGYVPVYEESKLKDASRNDGAYNTNSYPGFDPDNQYVGLEVPIDKLSHSTDDVSDNPMDYNWGGIKETENSIKSGKYQSDEVLVKR